MIDAVATVQEDTQRELPDGWRWVRLGDICRVVGGSTPSTSYTAYWDGDIIWVTPTDLGKLADVYIKSSARQITEAGYENCGAELIPAGSVVMSSRAPIGHLGIASVVLCTNQGCKSFVPGEEVDTNFLYFALKQAVPAIRSLGSGATFAEVSKTQLQQFVISLPPLAEQQRVAAILTEQLSAVEQARRAAETQLAAAKELPGAYLHAMFESDEVRGWRQSSIADVSSLVIDGPHVTPSYVSAGVPFLTVRNIVNRRIDLSVVSYITLDDHAAFSRRGKAEQGDILYTKDGTLGIPCVVDIDIDFSFFVSVALIKLRRDLVDPHFIAFALESPAALAQVKYLAAGAGLKHMVLKSIRSLKIPTPSLTDQKRVVKSLTEQLSAVQQTRKALEAQLESINQIPAALLRRAFSGNL